MHSVWKSLKMSHFNFQFWHFLPILVLLKLTCLVILFDFTFQVFKMHHFLAFSINFWLLKCKRSSLRSQYWMRHFLWFSNTVQMEWNKRFLVKQSKIEVKIWSEQNVLAINERLPRANLTNYFLLNITYKLRRRGPQSVSFHHIA